MLVGALPQCVVVQLQNHHDRSATDSSTVTPQQQTELEEPATVEPRTLTLKRHVTTTSYDGRVSKGEIPSEPTLHTRDDGMTFAAPRTHRTARHARASDPLSLTTSPGRDVATLPGICYAKRPMEVPMRRALALCVSVALLGCHRTDPSSNAPATNASPAPSAGPATPSTPSTQNPLPPVLPTLNNPFQALTEIPRLFADTDGGLLPSAVNWRSLIRFLPDRVGDLEATGAATGSTSGLGALQATHVSRTYRSGTREGRIEITDTSLVPVMRSGFMVAQSAFIDSPEQQRRGVTVGNHPAVLKWRRHDNRSQVQILVGNRYLLQLEVRPAATPDEAMRLAGHLDLSGLAAVR